MVSADVPGVAGTRRKAANMSFNFVGWVGPINPAPRDADQKRWVDETNPAYGAAMPPPLRSRGGLRRGAFDLALDPETTPEISKVDSIKPMPPAFRAKQKARGGTPLPHPVGWVGCINPAPRDADPKRWVDETNPAYGAPLLPPPLRSRGGLRRGAIDLALVLESQPDGGLH